MENITNRAHNKSKDLLRHEPKVRVKKKEMIKKSFRFLILIIYQVVKLIRAKGECLGIKNRRRTQKAAKSHGETHTV